MKKTFLFILLIFIMFACTNSSTKTALSSQTVERVVVTLSEKEPANRIMIEKGVKQVAKLWQDTDGSEAEFIQFCSTNYFSSPEEKQQVFLKISNYLEAIGGHYNEMTLQLQRTIHEAADTVLPIDELFAAYDPATHFSDDFYANKI
jgi:hypothetical protein